MTSAEDAFEARLRRIAGEAEPVPEHVLEAGRAAFALRDLDAELAALVADSAVDESGVLTRAIVSDVRMLSFECGSITVELDVESEPGSRLLRLSGLAVGAVGEVVVVRPESLAAQALTADGRFSVEGVEPGPMRLELTSVDGHRVTTSWVTL
jgi:hypothetical protein